MINESDMQTLIVMALPEENAGHLITSDLPVLYTGIGKVNATFALTKRLIELGAAEKPVRVINLGSAGSHTFKHGQTVCVRQFYQHDMNVTALGFDVMQTPFEVHLTPTGLSIPNLVESVCYTGDQFITEKGDWSVIDMEGYALAKVAHLLGCPFYCAKYITDGADGHSPNDWNERVKDAAVSLHQALHNIDVGLSDV